ncbi:MAG: DNA-binding response regulator [Caldilineae bacterium]|nr:MAG: DNA-binding response regulator [Caldilineae bacterium]
MDVLIVDDHILFREGLVNLLNAQPDIRVVGEAGSVHETIQMIDKLHPDIILMDVTLPDGTGLDATQAILAKQPDAKIVFLTVHEDDDRLFAAIRSGAKGYLLKNVPVSKLLSFLRGVSEGRAALSADMTSRILEEFSRLATPSSSTASPPEFRQLTAREIEILRELATGATNREIADQLIISEHTVKNHVRNILNKLNLKNRREVARFARQHGLINSSAH